ncbi:hypothetical protein ACFWAA_27025 [Streptomyces sp. NPDC059922]|uniref:hypothetical protein n=1 Tax=Streptomyces sp. NPDC059922 TaxID=3347005 RepID=UPI003655C5F8
MTDAAEQARQGATPMVTAPVPDLQLQLLIRLVGEDPQASLPVTLHTPGGVLHGDLIAHEVWKAEWARGLRQVEGDVAVLLARLPEAVDQVMGELQGEDGPHGLPQWIHLRDVTYLTSDTPVISRLWRGRLAHVSGWSLGKPQAY